MLRKISKWGNGAGIRLPKDLLDKIGLAVNDTVNVEIKDNRIVIIPKQSKSKLEQLFEQSSYDYKTQTYNAEIIPVVKGYGDEIS